MNYLFLLFFLGPVCFLSAANADSCKFGESVGIVENYQPNPSEHLDLVSSVEENRQCFSNRKNSCKTGTIHHVMDGYTDDHTAYYIILNDKLVFLNTTPYVDGTYGSEWGSTHASADFQNALNRIQAVTACEI